MKGNRGLSVLAGVILGAFLGFWIYFWPGYFLSCGPIKTDNLLIPSEIKHAYLVASLIFGVIPGTIVGFIAGLTFPFLVPRGHMARSIGCFCWILITALAWITQWSNIYNMSKGRIAITVLMTFISLAMIIPISGFLGEYIERIREIH